MPRPRLLISMLVTAVALATLSAPAEAGTYNVSTCESGFGSVNGAWVFNNTSPDKIDHADTCSTGLSTTTVLGVVGPGPGSLGEWRLTAPAGTRISHLRAVRWLGIEAGSGWRAFGRQGDGTILPGETCTVDPGQDECNVGPGSVEHDLDTNAIRYGIECPGPLSCVNGSTIHAARAAIYSALVTITDN